MEVKISGASDDLLYISKNGSVDELGAWVNGRTYKGFVSIKESNNRISVHVIYDGNWVFAVSHYAEFCDSKPDYERSLDGGRGYSEEITLQVEDNAKIDFLRS